MNRGDAEAQRIVDCRLTIDDCAQTEPTAMVALLGALARVCLIATNTLREIFDESGYARFLARNRLASSGAAYAAFLHEKNGGRPRRCC